jgi:hypothetical protein
VTHRCAGAPVLACRATYRAHFDLPEVTSKAWSSAPAAEIAVRKAHAVLVHMSVRYSVSASEHLDNTA